MPKILLVEDHADIRRLSRMTLGFEPVVSREAADAEVGLAVAQNWQPDLALLAVMMPGPMDDLSNPTSKGLGDLGLAVQNEGR